MSPTQHLADLGYVDPLDAEAQRQAERRRHADSLARAGALLEQGNLADGISLLQAVRAAAPDWIEPRRRLARASYLAGRSREALIELNWLEEHGVVHAELALLRGAVELGRRRLDEALASAEYAHALRSPLPAARVLGAQVYFRRGQIDLAERELDLAAEESIHDPPRADALALRAAIALRRSEWEEAAAWALQSLEANPSTAAVHTRLGVALAFMDRVDDGERALNRAAELGPLRVAPLVWLARLARRRGDRDSEVRADAQARARIRERRLLRQQDATR